MNLRMNMPQYANFLMVGFENAGTSRIQDLLKDRLKQIQENPSLEEVVDNIENKNSAGYDAASYEAFSNEFIKAAKEHRSVKYWKSRCIKIFRKRIQEIFISESEEISIDESLKYAYRLYKDKKIGNAFWDVFTVEDIKRNIIRTMEGCETGTEVVINA